MNRKYMIVALGGILLLASCQRKEDKIVTPSDDYTRFDAKIEESGVATRASITENAEDYTVQWNAGDTISINGMKYLANSSGLQSLFVVQPGCQSAKPPFGAFYPSSLDSSNLVLPSKQRYGGVSGTSVIIPDIPLFAHSSDNNLNFNFLCGVLAVKVDTSDISQVKSIRVSSDSAMCGPFELLETAPESGIYYAKLTSGEQKSVTLECSSPITMRKEPTIFYISVPVGTYTNVKIELSEDGTAYKQTMSTKGGETPKQIEILRNYIYPFNFALNSMVLSKDVDTEVQL